MSTSDREAPGRPGNEPRWTSAAKCGVGTAFSGNGGASLVWFTLAHGVISEIFFPRPDQPCTRELGLVVTDGQDFFSDEKSHATHETAWLG